QQRARCLPALQQFQCERPSPEEPLTQRAGGAWSGRHVPSGLTANAPWTLPSGVCPREDAAVSSPAGHCGAGAVTCRRGGVLAAAPHRPLCSSEIVAVTSSTRGLPPPPPGSGEALRPCSCLFPALPCSVPTTAPPGRMPGGLPHGCPVSGGP